MATANVILGMRRGSGHHLSGKRKKSSIFILQDGNRDHPLHSEHSDGQSSTRSTRKGKTIKKLFSDLRSEPQIYPQKSNGPSPQLARQYSETVDILKQQLKVPAYIIQPESNFLYSWNIFLGILLAYTALITPYEIAFCPAHNSVIFWIDIIVNLGFIIDVGVHFFCSFHELNKHMQRVHVVSLVQIAKQYLKGRFAVDVFSAFPVALVLSADLSFLRLVRLARLPEALRLAETIKEQRMPAQMQLNYSANTLRRYTLLLLLVGHWTACVWGWVARLGGGYDNSWIVGYCPDLECDKQTVHDMHFKLYGVSFYFSIMTITSIGYGNILPTTLEEHWACIFLMLLGASVWAYTIGSASSIIATMGSDQAEYYKLMQSLDCHIQANKYPKFLKKELHKFFRQYQSVALKQTHREVLDNMSPQLQYILLRWQSKWLKAVPWHTVLSPEFAVALLTNMDTKLYSKMEPMPSRNYLCTILCGVASRYGRVLVKGSSWGHDMILSSEMFMCRTTVRALTYCEVLTMRRKTFFEILEKFPEVHTQIRRWAAKMALRRCCHLLAFLHKKNWIMDSEIVKSRLRLRSKELTEKEHKEFTDLISNLRKDELKKPENTKQKRLTKVHPVVFCRKTSRGLPDLQTIQREILLSDSSLSTFHGASEEDEVRYELQKLEKQSIQISELLMKNKDDLEVIQRLIQERL